MRHAPRFVRPALTALTCALLAPSGVQAQAWSVGRPDALPEFSTPAAPVYKPRGKAAKAQPQTVELGPDGGARGDTTLHPTGVVDPDGSTVVSELLVVARASGPAMWRVKRGASEVVVLGSWSPLAHLQVWDRGRLTTNLEGARALLMPPEPKVGVFEGAKLMLRAGAVRLPGFKPLRAELPPTLATKFAQAVKIARSDPKRYDKWRPAAAGLLLLGDFHRAAGLSDLKPGTTIAKLAKDKGVRVERTGRLGVGGALDAMVGLPPDRQLACLDAAADQVIFEAAHVRAAGQAWADGRLRDLRGLESNAVLDRCLLPQANVRAVLDRAAGDAAKAVDEALAKPGRTVAVVDLRLLDRPSGVLDRLKAEGAEISAPSGAR